MTSAKMPVVLASHVAAGTPLPVFQHAYLTDVSHPPACRNMRKQSVKTVLQSVVLNRHTDSLPVMKARQRSAFPPNYIHSIDSSHMMLTALACAEEGTCLSTEQ